MIQNKLRIVNVTTEYTGFIDRIYRRFPEYHSRSCAGQLELRARLYLGISDFYSYHLSRMGMEGFEIYSSDEILQKQWARENGFNWGKDYEWKPVLRKGWIPWVTKRPLGRWFFEITKAQIKALRPDVLINQSIDELSPDFIAEIRPMVRLIVGQIASPTHVKDFSCYDVILSSLPNLVEFFRAKGIAAENFRLGFEPRILSYPFDRTQKIDVSFVGSLTPIHKKRTALLEYLAEKVKLKIWGLGAEQFEPGHPIRRCHQGIAAGIDMYQILAQSRITLNSHLDFSGSHANNMRLYEATGMGVCLLTDWKEDLDKIFDPEVEVATYRTKEECLEKIQTLLNNPQKAERIARAGKQKTLSRHSYAVRMQELLEILSPYWEKRQDWETKP